MLKLFTRFKFFIWIEKEHNKKVKNKIKKCQNQHLLIQIIILQKKKGLKYLFTLFAAKPIFFKTFQLICFSIF